MNVADGLSKQQRGVAARMAAAAGVTVVTVAACLLSAMAAPVSLPERLIVVASCDAFVVFWLAAAVGNVARMRFFSVEDIGGRGIASADVNRGNAVLQNTLEQVVLAVPVHVALAVLLASSVPLIVALTALFTVGRLLFWTGYAKGAEGRALGFALTFYPTVAGLLIALVSAASFAF